VDYTRCPQTSQGRAAYLAALLRFDWSSCPEVLAMPQHMRYLVCWLLAKVVRNRPSSAAEALQHPWFSSTAAEQQLDLQRAAAAPSWRRTHRLAAARLAGAPPLRFVTGPGLMSSTLALLLLMVLMMTTTVVMVVTEKLMVTMLGSTCSSMYHQMAACGCSLPAGLAQAGLEVGGDRERFVTTTVERSWVMTALTVDGTDSDACF